MKYYAFVETSQNIENARMCPTMETAFAVAIMANAENPVAAVRDENGEVVTIDPRQQPIKLDWITRSSFVLVKLDDDELMFRGYDQIPTIPENSALLIHCVGNSYVVGNTGEKHLDIDNIEKLIHPADIQNRIYECGIGPLVKKTNKLVFNYPNSKFTIEGTVSEDGNIPDMDSRLIPKGKMMILSAPIGTGSEMRFVGKFSSVVKIYEKAEHHPVYKYFYVQDGSGKFHSVKNPRIVSVDL